jgi:acyl transferase domain-containing protein
LYGEQGVRYLTLEAGYMGQLLMTGQAACRIGLCPVGEVNLNQVAPALDLPPGTVFLQSFLGGAADYPATTAAGERPAFTEPAFTRPVSTGLALAGAVSAASLRPLPLAITGLAGRYPGAADLDGFWRLLAGGGQVIGELPAARAQAARAVRDPLPDIPGGYLDDIGTFDAQLFGLSPREAATIDPQARVLLPVVWQCLENAGHTADSLNREAGRVGVFVGVMWLDHNQVGADQWRRSGKAEISAAGSDIASRLSHFFDFRGPSVAVDTSCASALTALHLAAESVGRGECGAAVVAAVNLIGHPYHAAALDGLGLLAPGGSRRAFDASRSGWSPGEGAGAFLVRPLAEAGSDTVSAVVAATWAAHSGRTSQYGAPDAAALAGSVRAVLDRAGLEPADVDYVECAAAGASVADSAEIDALAQVFSSRPAALGAVPIGTVKPNIGHLESAAGLAQLAKVVLQIGHRELAPTLVADDLNPLADWSATRLRPVRGREPYAGRAAVLNALSAGGSSAHAVVRAAEPGNRPAQG